MTSEARRGGDPSVVDRPDDYDALSALLRIRAAARAERERRETRNGLLRRRAAQQPSSRVE